MAKLTEDYNWMYRDSQPDVVDAEIVPSDGPEAVDGPNLAQSIADDQAQVKRAITLFNTMSEPARVRFVEILVKNEAENIRLLLDKESQGLL